jgi:hypothetical protein
MKGPMTLSTLDNAIAKGLDFLAGRQLPTGQFPIEVTFHYKEGAPTEQDQSLFATAHIVYSLGFLPHPTVQPMIARALTYFQAEMSGHGLWRFWSRGARWDDRRLWPFIPADLDDTSSISLLLKRHGVPFPDNRSLMLLNRSRAGLFYTWLVLRPTPSLKLSYWRSVLADFNVPRYTIFWKATEAGYNDIDGVVNANVALYLGDRPETRQAISWLIKVVESGQEATCDKWYRDRFTFCYALSRGYHAGIEAFDAVREPIIARLSEAAQASGQIGDHILHTALAANTLLNFNHRSRLLTHAIEFLQQSQSREGSWPSAPYYYGGPQQSVSWGSAELTTGLCLEALYRSAAEASPSTPGDNAQDDQYCKSY